MKTDRINTLLVISIVLTVASGVITYFAVRESTERVEIVIHTEEVMRESTALLSLVKDRETAYRDYLIFHDSSAIDNFDEAHHQVKTKLARLKHLVADNPGQVILLQRRVERLIDENANDQQHAFFTDEHEDHKSPERRALVDNRLDSVRFYLDTFNRREQRLLTVRLDAMQEILTMQRKIRYVSLVLIGLTSLLALVTLIGKQKANDVLISDLQVARKNLEEKVKDRTVELEKKNKLTEKLNRDLRENFDTLEKFYEALQVKNVRTEDALREIEFLYDNAACGYHSLSPDGTIIRINQTELNWLGYQRDEVVNKLSLADVIAPEETTLFHQRFAEFLHDGTLRNMKHYYRRKDGSTFPVLINSTAVYDRNNNYIMSRAAVVDISGQENAQLQLVQVNKKLRLLNEEKNNFLNIAAHDMKSPLNGILGLLHLIRNHHSNLTSEQQEYLLYIEQSCTNMKQMVTNLLDINRIEQGFHSITPAPCSLTELVRQQASLHLESARRKQILLMLEDNAEDIFITTDAAALARVIDNLISNALKFSPPNQSVWIKVSRTDVRAVIEVIDHGPGIKSEEVGMLFLKFKRLSAKPTGGESSTGLGLSIVKELVHALHGTISVESEPGRGTRFVVELPLSITPEDKVALAKNSK